MREVDIVRSLLAAALPYELAAGQQAKAENIVRGALERWIGTGLDFARTTSAERLFDPAEVFNHMKWEGLEGRDEFWEHHFIRTARSLTQQAAGQGKPLHALPKKTFSVQLRRRFDLRDSASSRKVRLRLPLPLSSHAQDVQVTPISPAGVEANIAQSEGRLEFQFHANAPGPLEIGAHLGFATNGMPLENIGQPLGEGERELYLRPLEGLVRISPRVAELAKSLDGADSSLEVATNALNFLIDGFSCGMVQYDQIDAQAPGDWVLDNGWYDCQLGSSLFISICRARGIPARLASGYMLYDLAPGYHYWPEIWQDGIGWQSFDLLNWDLSAGGRDMPWRTRFAGAIDYRMATQCFPLSFTGSMTVRFPPAWHLLNAPIDGGFAIHFTTLEGDKIYSDEVVIS